AEDHEQAGGDDEQQRRGRGDVKHQGHAVPSLADAGGTRPRGARPRPWAGQRSGHCSPGSTSGKRATTVTEPSACTSPRYMVSGAWCCFDMAISPRGPLKDTSGRAASTAPVSVLPAFSTAAL